MIVYCVLYIIALGGSMPCCVPAIPDLIEQSQDSCLPGCRSSASCRTGGWGDAVGTVCSCCSGPAAGVLQHSQRSHRPLLSRFPHARRGLLPRRVQGGPFTNTPRASMLVDRTCMLQMAPVLAQLLWACKGGTCLGTCLSLRCATCSLPCYPTSSPNDLLRWQPKQLIHQHACERRSTSPCAVLMWQV